MNRAALGQKVREAVKTLRLYGVSGVIRAIRRKMGSALFRNEALHLGALADLFELVPTYRYATCDDLVRLKAKYPGYCLPDIPDRQSPQSRAWGLKQMGTLFCAEKIHQVKPTSVLEIGAGDDTFFDRHFGHLTEYWMVDEGDYNTSRGFEKAVREREQTRFVRGLLGSYSPDLPDSYFSLIISVSVLEHVAWEKKDDVYSDMYRLLKPGGWMVHSIDAVGEGASREFVHMKRAGFILPRRPQLRICVNSGEVPATLFEPLALVYLNYFGVGRGDMWTVLRSVTGHHPTVLAAASKPQTQADAPATL